MAKTSLLTIIIIILFSGYSVGAARRTEFRSAITSRLEIAPSGDYGICSSMVKNQGYACEEHLVIHIPPCFCFYHSKISKI